MTFVSTLFRRVLRPMALGATALVLAVSPSSAKPESYTIDPEHFVIAFFVDHIGYAKVLGVFEEAEGSFVYDEATQTLTDLKVEIDAESVNTNHSKRDKHVRSSDFLDADDHDTITFVGTGAKPVTATTGQVFGDLTLRGITKPVVLDVTLNKTGNYPFGHGDYVLGLSLRTTLKRSDFAMTYALEPNFVGDEVEVLIELEARRE